MNEFTTHDACGCCEGEAPAPVLYNRPGLSSLAYRIRTYGDALEAMRSTLARPYLNVLTGRLDAEGRREAERIELTQGLTTRADDDPAQALLDAWAVAVDVLTFYQERIANEGYLRTAAERRSILELARAIGYELSPALAASTHLAFTVETAPGAPSEAAVDVGTRVMSIPGQDELPQTFETSADITARAAWNALQPRLSVPNPPAHGMDTLYFQGTGMRLEAGDAILIVGDERLNDPAPKDDNHWDFRILESVTRVTTPDPANSYTVVKVKPLGEVAPRPMNPAAQRPRAYVFRARAALFGHNAPDWRPLAQTTKLGYLTGDAAKNCAADPSNCGTEWPEFHIKNPAGKAIDLDRTYPKVLPGSWLVLEKAHYVELYQVKSVATASRTDYLLTGQVTHVGLDTDLGLTSFGLRETAVFIEPEELTLAEKPVPDPLYDHEIILDGTYPDLARGQPLALSGKRQRVRTLIDGLTLALDVPDAAGPPDGTGATTRTLAAHDTLQMLAPPTFGGETLLPAQLVTRLAALTDSISWRLIDRDGATGLLTANGAQVALAPAEEDDEVVREVVVIDDSALAVRVERDDTILLAEDPLTACYDRATVTLNANTVHATHGQTVAAEVLGSGDAGKANQRFWLKKPPLTYVSAATATGALSTLSVRVNQVQWQELPSLYGLTPQDQAYTVRIEDDGETAVVFGDGIQGARPPSGFENVVATYRTGAGPDGEVKAGQLSLLQTRPLGIREVTNPVPATGAAPAEEMEDARENAPNTVLTLDRIVSLRDYEDFTRSFRGIGKARADRLWTGQDFLIHVTAATASGDPLAPGDVYDNLIDAINAARDPLERLVVSGYTPVTFSLEASVLIDTPRYLAEDVLADVRAQLEATFAFDARDFGQPVTLAEVVTAIQQVTGVIAVDMISLARDATGSSVAAGAGIVQAAGKGAAKKAISQGNLRGVKGLTARGAAPALNASRAGRGVTVTLQREKVRGVKGGGAKSGGKQTIIPIPHKRGALTRAAAGSEPPAVLPAKRATFDTATDSIILAELLLLNPAGVVLQEMTA
jgi:predicted phage baseplate assembly protein